ncbi:HCF164 [Symbiodinium natans]|uniref:HCF164 protein n=1 Tax=Symbiodinium natans TaxID=878477 RepID=A0A812R6D7_9DINO|nr:HCF164 [Symbiodinium natans]
MITVVAFMITSKISSRRAEQACAALVGQEAPDIQLIEQASGSTTTLKEFLAKNKKPTVIDFYQNFCPACGPAAEKIEQLAGDEKYKDKVNFMLVNMGSRDDAVKYAKERNLKDAWHGHGKPPSDYGVMYIPHKVLIDSDGKVVKNYKVELPSDLELVLNASKKES